MKSMLKTLGLTAILAASGLVFQNAKAESVFDYSDRMYSKGFNHTNEMMNIVFHSKRIGIDCRLLMAIRESENGSDNIAYGVMPLGADKEKYDSDNGYMFNGQFYPYQDEVEKQMCWSAWTIRKRWEDFISLSQEERAKYKDFISYLGDFYSPVEKNKPKSPNVNWKRNVRTFYNRFSNS